MDGKLLSRFEEIASGLANEGIAIIDGFLSPDEVLAIHSLDEFKNGLKRFRQAGIGKHEGKQINESIRGDSIQWVDRSSAWPPLQCYIDRLNQLTNFLNQSLFLSLKDFEIHLTIYPKGSFYKRHLDQFKRDDHRKLSVICYLNDNWMENDGGQLRVHFPAGSKDFLPIAGRLVCFRSDLLEHEVLPATRDRLSITGWLLDASATGF